MMEGERKIGEGQKAFPFVNASPSQSISTQSHMNVGMEILENSQKFFEKTLALNVHLCNNYDCKEIQRIWEREAYSPHWKT